MRQVGFWRSFERWACVLLWGKTIVFLELAGEVAAVVIAQAVSGLVDVATFAEQFDSPLHSQPLEPAARGLLHGGKKEPFQSADRDAAGFGPGAKRARSRGVGAGL